jgi:Putative prokaryotic signal transducing protein
LPRQPSIRQAWSVLVLYETAEYGHGGGMMEELLRSNDLVYLSFVRHVLEEEGIDFLQLDDHMSVLEGSIGVLPRRIMVASELIEQAKRALGNASLTIQD